jgi:hypothetical protein
MTPLIKFTESQIKAVGVQFEKIAEEGQVKIDDPKGGKILGNFK